MITVYPNINRKDYPTLYPAGAQIFFRGFYSLVGDSVTGFKAIMVLFDILTLLVLAALLRSWGLNTARLIIYAWNPLVIFEISYSGHLEGITVFLMTAALYLHAARKKVAAIFMLALSAAVKLYPALILAAFLNRGSRLKGIIIFSSTITLLYLPFIGAGTHLSGFLPVYLNNPYESFNLGFKYLLMGLMPGLEYRVLSWLFIVALAIAGLVVFLKHKENMPDGAIWLYANRLVDDSDAGLAASLVCDFSDPISGDLSQPCLVDFYMHREPVLLKVYVTPGYYAHVGAAGGISAAFCNVERRICTKQKQGPR